MLAALQYNVSAAAAVSAVRTSCCNKLFLWKETAPFPLVPACTFNRSFINKHLLLGPFPLFAASFHFVLRGKERHKTTLYYLFSVKRTFGKPTWLRLANSGKIKWLICQSPAWKIRLIPRQSCFLDSHCTNKYRCTFPCSFSGICLWKNCIHRKIHGCDSKGISRPAQSKENRYQLCWHPD